MTLNNSALENREDLFFENWDTLSSWKKGTSAIIQKAINLGEISREQIIEMKDYWFWEKEIVSIFNKRLLDLLAVRDLKVI